MAEEINSTLISQNEVPVEDLSGATPLQIAEKAVAVLDGKLAKNIRILKVQEQTVIADYFVICSANSTTQVKALADEVEYKLGLCGVKPLHTDGVGGGEWTVIDFNTVIVHVFIKAAREFYKLDKLWEQATQIAAYDEEI